MKKNLTYETFNIAVRRSLQHSRNGLGRTKRKRGGRPPTAISDVDARRFVCLGTPKNDV